MVASCGITCRSILFLLQIGKCFLWVESCWFHQQNLILRTCSQGTCSHIYMHSCGSCWGKLVTAQTKKPYRQNAEEAEQQFALLTAWKKKSLALLRRNHCLLRRVTSTVLQSAGQPHLNNSLELEKTNKQKKRSRGTNSAAIQGGSLICASPVETDNYDFELVWS